MNFELFDAASEFGEALFRNSKFKIENSKLEGIQTATQQSELRISENGTLSPETR
jgi:hypothetical protein